jgi:PAS domain S-box-containing protein
MNYNNLTREQAIDMLRLFGRAHDALRVQNDVLREVQRALETSCEHYADLYDLAPVAYLTLDHDGVVREANFAGTCLLGLDRVSVIGKPFVDLVRFEDPSAFSSHLGQCVASGVLIETEMTFTTSQGVVEVKALSTPIPKAGLSGGSIRIAFIDVSRRVATERELARVHETERQLRHRLETIDHASVAVAKALTATPRGDVTAFLRVIADEARLVAHAEYAAVGVCGRKGVESDRWGFAGMTPEQERAFMDLPCAGELFPLLPRAAPLTTSVLAVAIRYEGENRGNLYLANKRGAAEFSEEDQIAISMLADRVAVALEIARLQDVEQRERRRLDFLATAGTVLAESIDYEATLKAVACVVVPELADVSLVELRGEDGRFRRVAAHHVDRSKQKLLGETPEPVDCRLLPAHSREAIASRQPQRRELSARDVAALAVSPSYGARFGELKPRSLLTVPLAMGDEIMGLMHLVTVEGGRPQGDENLPLAREIAERAVLAIEAARLHRATESAVSARDSLLRVVSHDLYGLLNTVIMGTDLLLQARPSDDRREGRTRLIAIQRAAEQMDQLIGSFRDVTMIDTGQFSVKLYENQPEALIRDAASILGPQMEAASLQFDVEIEADLPDVLCDHERILQVFLNVMSNALKFARGTRALRVGAKLDGDAVCFWVTDDGVGMSEHDRCHVFERYWRGAEGAEGTGLGLYIAKGIVEAHGGRIWIESTLGQGTTMYFSLPRAIPDGPSGKFSIKPPHATLDYGTRKLG